MGTAIDVLTVSIGTVSGISLFCGLVILIVHFWDKKLHKNPCKFPFLFHIMITTDNLLLNGIIIVDEIMVIHLVFSVLSLSRSSLVGCQLVGLIGVFATFAAAAYHLYLSELILSITSVFNPKDLSHLKYHFYAIMTGLFFSMFSIVIEDIGITVKLL